RSIAPSGVKRAQGGSRSGGRAGRLGRRAEAPLGVDARTLDLGLSITRLRGRLQGAEQPARGRRDLVDRRLESLAVDLRRLVVAADLAYVLQGGVSDVLLGRRRFIVEQRSYVPAHRSALLSLDGVRLHHRRDHSG